MKAARLVVMLGALAAAGGAGVLALNLANREPETQIVEVQSEPRVETEDVLVAADDVSLGSGMSPKQVRWQQWPKASLAGDFVLRSGDPDGVEKIEGAIARASFYKGEPIRESKLVRSDRGYMSAILPSGQRAIATAISTETSAGGFILPNDKVDVILTRRSKSDQGEGFLTETILENVRILAIDQTVEEKDGESVVVGQTATLQLSPREAEILTAAQQMADRLTLTLRSVEDSKGGVTTKAGYLIGGERGAGIVRVIKFGNAKDVTVQQAK